MLVIMFPLLASPAPIPLLKQHLQNHTVLFPAFAGHVLDVATKMEQFTLREVSHTSVNNDAEASRGQCKG